MRLFSSHLLIILVASLFLLSCGSSKKAAKAVTDPTKNHPDIAKMSKEAKAEMDKLSANACECLKQHGEELNTFVDEALSMLKEAQTKEDANPMEVMGKLMGSIANIRAFGECVQKVGDNINQELLDEEMKKIIGEDADPKVKEKKQLEITNAFLGKNCPKEQQVFQKFVDFTKEVEALINRINKE